MQPQELQHAFYEMLMESQYWSPQQLQNYQRSQLEQLLRHARKNVPFYEKRLDAVFPASGDIDWGRWEEIPIVKRSDMVEHREAMQATEHPKGHGASGTISSSGSTGRPIQITNNRLTALAANANRWRAHRWHGLDWSLTLAARGDPKPGSDPEQGRDLGPWGPPWVETSRQGRAVEYMRSFSPQRLFDYLRETETRYLSWGAKNLHAVALEAERLGVRLDIRYVLTHGQQTSPADEAVFARVWGAPCLDHYSSKEGGQMAYTCPSGHGLHVNAESLLIEIVDADGRAVPQGIEGRVVVTPFVSTAQPLIRYDQGDIARFGARCPCGRGLPVIAGISGRTLAIFRHPDGRQMAKMLTEDTRVALGATFWQIAQVGPLSFEIRYVPVDWAATGDEASAVADFRRVYFADAEVRCVRTREIPLSAAGKYLEYVNEWSRDQEQAEGLSHG
jgi:phenylacetate-CoA ligase